MADKPDDGGSVIPTIETIAYSSGTGSRVYHPGLSLRDYFAAAALQGWLASFGQDTAHPADGHRGNENCAANAKFAYALADAMLKARQS
jgi:hypothetical protein